VSESPSPHHVLLVDDDDDILDALGTLIELQGITVERAPSGFAALKALQSGPGPCLVLLDVRMPGMSGWDVVAWMQREPTTAGIPVVMITGESPNRAEARARGVIDVLQKPVDAEQVVDTITRCCGQMHGA
jgi:CheY-like chemotaxis protein